MKRLVFHHINKCAGTTLLYALQNHFDARECLLMEEYQARHGIGEADLPDFDDVSRVRFIHEPSSSRNWKAALPNVSTFVMLRDPIDRLYSQWMMIKAWSDEEASRVAGFTALRDAARAGFECFLDRDDPLSVLNRWNGLTGYLLLGAEPWSERWLALEGLRNPAFARDALDLAIANLSAFDFLGLVEQFDLSYDAMAVAFPFPAVEEVQAHNVRGGRTYRAGLDRQALNAASAATSLDQILYQEACSLFAQQVAQLRAEYGEDLKLAATARHLESLSRPPEWALVSMAEPLRGTGWHAREINGAKISRWMGPEPVATLDVEIEKKGVLFVRARCTGFVNPEQIANFKMTADGWPVPLDTWISHGRFRYFEGAIPSERLRAGPVLHLEMDCGSVDRSPDQNDPRRLGLEFAEIEVGPARGFNRCAPGTPTRSAERRSSANALWSPEIENVA